jgi:4-hydroxy-tetrahydrodipicolinate synthase
MVSTLTPAILAELADTPEIVCIKEESGDSRRVTDIYNALGDRFLVFCGVDDLILESTVLGATGWVSGMTNAWPQESVALFQLCRDGLYGEARALYRILTPAFHLDFHVKLVQYIKLAEHIVYGAPKRVWAPRMPLQDSEREDVMASVGRTINALAARQVQAA